MKCICGYEHESGIDDNGNYQKNLIGDQEFHLITGSTFKIIIDKDYRETREIILYACPKCHTIKADI